MMKHITAIAVWMYLVAATVAEVLVFYSGPGHYTVEVAIATIAGVSAIVTAIFSMNLRKEPAAVQYIFLAPVLLVMVLILTMVLAFA
jgi:hypothetical protein